MRSILLGSIAGLEGRLAGLISLDVAPEALLPASNGMYACLLESYWDSSL